MMAVSVLLFAVFNTCLAQTYTHCNPLIEDCEPNPALGRSMEIDFANDGPTSAFKPTGSATIIYDPSEGALFGISSPGHNPTLQSKFYIMFGRISVVARAAEGAGVISSIVLQSDDLDEIDIEFVGSDPKQFQTNYFGKGDTTSYDRGKCHLIPGKSITDEFHEYDIEWTADAIKWYVDGQLVRLLNSSSRPDIYPQSPMALKIGAWAAGDPSYNKQGTIDWAGGPINYAEGPFTYAIKSVVIEDYSTGTKYEYLDKSGNWESIKAHDGKIGAGGPVSQLWFKRLINLSRPI